VRKVIKDRLEELEKIKHKEKDGIISMLVSEEVLKKDWDNKPDERWDKV